MTVGYAMSPEYGHPKMKRQALEPELGWDPRREPIVCGTKRAGRVVPCAPRRHANRVSLEFGSGTPKSGKPKRPTRRTHGLLALPWPAVGRKEVDQRSIRLKLQFSSAP